MKRRSKRGIIVFAAVLAATVFLLPFMSWLYADSQRGAKDGGRFTVLTTLPVAAVAPLAEEYGRLTGVKAEFVPVERLELLERVRDKRGKWCWPMGKP